ncbi:hypothetical protein SLA2020_296970 [Shorea laevis]
MAALLTEGSAGLARVLVSQVATVVFLGRHENGSAVGLTTTDKSGNDRRKEAVNVKGKVEIFRGLWYL